MALITKLADGKPITRTFKRGNDQVDLNLYIDTAESGFNDWLNSVDIKDKDKKAVRAAYSDIINRINTDPNSFTARLGGGFDNTAGITNATSGFDAYGAAAGYLGNTLRHMPKYIEPEKPSTKIKYVKGSPIITSKLQKEVMGSDPTAFTMLDDLQGTKRSTAQRDAVIISFLKGLEGRYDFDSDEDKLDWQNRINNAISGLTDKKDNNDRYILSQLGFTNLDDYYATDFSTQSSQPNATGDNSGNYSETAGNNAGGSVNSEYNQFKQWLAKNYPDPVKLHKDVSLNTTGKPVREAVRHYFYQGFRNLTDDDLVNWLSEYISNIDNYNVNDNQYMRKILTFQPQFSNGAVMADVVQNLIKKGIMKPISNGSNKYLVPKSIGKTTNGGQSAYIYDKNTNSLQEVSVNDIPILQEQIINKYKQARGTGDTSVTSSRYGRFFTQEDNTQNQETPSQKNGGVLKAAEGTILQPSLVSPYWSELNFGRDSEGNLYGADQTLTGWEGARHNRRTSRIGEPPVNPTITGAYEQQRRYVNSGSIIPDVRTAYANWRTTNTDKTYQDFVNYYNNIVQKARDISQTKFQKGYKSNDFEDLYTDYNWLYNSSAAQFDPEKGFLGAEPKLSKVLGQTMFNRTPLAFNDNNEAAKERLGLLVDNDLSSQVWVNNEGKLELRPATASSEVLITDNTRNNLSNGLKSTKLDETELAKRKLKELQSKYWNEAATMLLGAGRLGYSIGTNNRIAKIVDAALEPVLTNTYERYSPVTGDFGTAQYYNQAASQLMSNANRPYTSDANLNTARSLSGQVQSNNTRLEGNLKDNEEIKATAKEALLRQEDNMSRRSDVANKNRASIIQNNINKAQLEASRIKQNWISTDNYLKNIETEAKTKIANDKARAENFALETEQFKNQQEYLNNIGQLRDAYNKWKTLPGNQNKTLSEFDTETNGDYSRALAQIKNNYSEGAYKAYSNVHGYPFVTTSTKFKISDYPKLIFKKGGTLSLYSQLLINKALRNANNT